MQGLFLWALYGKLELVKQRSMFRFVAFLTKQPGGVPKAEASRLCFL